MAPLVAQLLSSGITLLGNVLLSKGKEAVESKLGVKLPDLEKPASPEQIADLRKLQFEHEEKLLEFAIKEKELELKAEEIAQGAVTERWKADMLSDSWLSKNIRPMVLIFLLSAYSLFSVASAFSLFVTQAYVELLGNMLMLVISAYFIGRTSEKIVDMKERGK
jgi:hypothetical protein